MNFFRLSFLSVLIVALSACSKDDDGPATCTQSDWVGTYDGTINCDGTTEDVTVVIAANGAAALDVSYTTSSSSTTYTEPLTPMNCDLDISGTEAGITVTLDASLDGDKLTMKEVILSGGATSTCDITATRK